MKRTDLAAPSVIDPAAFTFVAGVYFGSNPSEDFDALLSEWMAEKDVDGKAGWYSKRPAVLTKFPPLNPAGNFVRKGTCDHCGARFDWGSVYQHTSGAHIVVGNVCADKTMDVPSRLELDVRRMKARIAAARETARNAAAARAQSVTGGYEWLYAGPHNHATLDDIARKGLAWGGLTERQVELVKRIHDGTPAEWEVKKAAKAAARAAEESAAQPVPVTTERMEITGEVLTIKEQEGYAPGGVIWPGQSTPTVFKMLVRTDAGYKLWGTVPRDLEIQQGSKIAFSAKIERSKDDPKFGFFSRPTKAKVIVQVVAG